MFYTSTSIPDLNLTTTLFSNTVNFSTKSLTNSSSEDDGDVSFVMPESDDDPVSAGGFGLIQFLVGAVNKGRDRLPLTTCSVLIIVVLR